MLPEFDDSSDTLKGAQNSNNFYVARNVTNKRDKPTERYLTSAANKRQQKEKIQNNPNFQKQQLTSDYSDSKGEVQPRLGIKQNKKNPNAHRFTED